MIKEYNFLRLLDDYKSPNYEENLSLIANSKIENKIFVKQFIIPGSYDKVYWDSFALIIVKRGIKRVTDILYDIMNWYKDMNWPGFPTINNFVLNNKLTFIPVTIDLIEISLEIKDIIWFKNLLSVYLTLQSNLLNDHQKILISETLEYLEDDNWKNLSFNIKDIIV